MEIIKNIYRITRLELFQIKAHKITRFYLDLDHGFQVDFIHFFKSTMSLNK
jgi:hypothetical protein